MLTSLTKKDRAAADDAGFWFLDTHIHIAMAQRDNAEGISVLEHRMPFGSASPLHVHHDEDEIFHLLEGAMEVEVGLERFVAIAGETFVGPRAVPHRFRVISPQGARLLTISRGGFEDMVRTASRPASAPVLPTVDGPPTLEQQQALAAICTPRGIDIVGPPLS